MDSPIVAMPLKSVRKVASQSRTKTLRSGLAMDNPNPTAGARSMQSVRSTSKSRR